jgi:hypothetical protein
LGSTGELEGKILTLPLVAAFDLYGVAYVCYSYSDFDLKDLSMMRFGDFKYLKNEGAMQTAKALMAIARS